MRFQVGIVGVQPGRSWGAVAHLPALAALPNHFTVGGVANTGLASSRAAADACGIERAFASPAELINCPDIDVVAVTVKAPNHLDIVTAAIAAGKHVFCEWPLGKDLAEAQVLARRAREHKRVCVIGLQALAAPQIRYAKELIDQGVIGAILSTKIVGSGANWGASVDHANAYTLDPANGATLLSIPVGHVMAALQATLGKVVEVSAMLVNRRRRVRIKETGIEVPMSSPDQVLINATLTNGVPLSLHYRGGMSEGTNFRWEIHGSDGELHLSAAAGHAQFMELTLSLANGEDSEFRVVKAPAHPVAPDLGGKDLPLRARNVAALYAWMAEDLCEQTHLAPSFDTALATHCLLEAIEQSARTGRRVRPESC